MNKLIFLGTGSAAHLTRQLTSLCFLFGNHAFLVDCGDGMGTMRNLIKAGVSIEQVNDVIITHKHADHIAGMMHYLFLKMLEQHTRVHVYGPKQAVAAVKTISVLTHTLTKRSQERIDFCSIRSGEPVNILHASVEGTTVKHVQGYVCYAYAITAGGIKIVFTGDMRPNKHFDQLARGADIMIHECYGLDTHADVFHAWGHCTGKDAGLDATKAGAKHLILTHISSRDYAIDPKLLAEEARKYFSGTVTVAEDLMEVPLA